MRRIALRCLEKLEVAAHRRLPPEQVLLFMNNAHPKLKGKRWREYCVDEATLAACLSLMEALPRRR